MIQRLDTIGHALDGTLGRIEAQLTSPVRAGALGAALGVAVVVGGLATFIMVLVLLVQLFE